MTDLTLGPFTLPAAPLAALAAILLGFAIANRIAARTGVQIERRLWLLAAAAVLAARAVFVFRYRAFYMEEPLRMLDLRDGGFTPLAGIAAALALGAWLAWRDRRAGRALLVGVLTAWLAWGAGSVALALVKPDRQSLPQLVLTDLDGRDVPMAALAGQPLVVNLWATWCPPCRREMPELARAQRSHRDVCFVFVNQGETVGDIRAYLQAQGLQLENVLLDRTGRLAKATNSPGMPTTLFFDAKGALVERRLGQMSAATVARAIEPLRRP
ncbi:TlpA family protein disulfide reductase [Massilia norwichensis]|uniref:TlpA family protein disulfide reductase n=1 Tax=Massilia norwichensis TaxID=1442366 RepID=A0ABT2A7T7_9BURK|nr:TlpA disulfide reductase family protein [Massilia norwichensis]MCS0590269.1 TlpA family protein disulfide reductase [Massilia norwichensis]